MVWLQRQFQVLFSMCIALMIVNCSSPEKGEVSQTAQTFISLYPAITETIYHLGAQDQLVGRSDYCTFSTEVQKKPAFGSSLTPNFEAIARANPEGLLLDDSVGNPLADLQRITTVHQYPWLGTKEMQESIVKLGTLLQKEEEAKQLADKISKALSSTAKETSPRMLVLMEGSDFSKGQIWFMRHGSLHGEAIEAAGFRNAAPAEFQGPPQMSLEQLLQQDPDIILFMTGAQVEFCL